VGFSQWALGVLYAITSSFIPTKGGSLIEEYLQSEEYFRSTFKESILNMFNHQYESKLIAALSKYYAIYSFVVSIHIRRGDLLSLGYMNFPPDAYFRKAIESFEQQFPNVGFLVVSADIEWCKSQNIFQRRNIHVLAEPHLRDIQFGIISYSDGVILSMGTFGWWAAEFDLSHSVNKGKVNVNSYYPISWKKLTLESSVP
jgi:hypothetical protein